MAEGRISLKARRLRLGLGGVYHIFWFAGEKGFYVIDGGVEESLAGLFCDPADMRGDEAIFGGQEGIIL